MSNDTEWYNGDPMLISKHKEIELTILQFANNYPNFDGDRDVLKSHLVVFFELAMGSRNDSLDKFQVDIMHTRDAGVVDVEMLKALLVVLEIKNETCTKVIELWEKN
ncbi:hypothetical protein KBD69_02960 [Candidatus Woesebacteria bacterium]|nr:hypothetical protein [Candidatus Woesebacteria bacterium]